MAASTSLIGRRGVGVGAEEVQKTKAAQCFAIADGLVEGLLHKRRGPAPDVIDDPPVHRYTRSSQKHDEKQSSLDRPFPSAISYPYSFSRLQTQDGFVRIARTCVYRRARCQARHPRGTPWHGYLQSAFRKLKTPLCELTGRSALGGFLSEDAVPPSSFRMACSSTFRTP